MGVCLAASSQVLARELVDSTAVDWIGKGSWLILRLLIVSAGGAPGAW